MSDGQREALQALSRSQTAPHRQVRRAKALLLAADGVANVRIAAQVGVKPATVRAWRARFVEEGLAKLGKVRAGRGRKSTIPQEKIDEIVHLTRHSTPDGQTHWSCRTMADKAGVSPATVQRVWAARGLKPHLVETFKLSNDPKFEEKLIDVAKVEPQRQDRTSKTVWTMTKPKPYGGLDPPVSGCELRRGLDSRP
jgi:transposase